MRKRIFGLLILTVLTVVLASVGATAQVPDELVGADLELEIGGVDWHPECDIGLYCGREALDTLRPPNTDDPYAGYFKQRWEWMTSGSRMWYKYASTVVTRGSATYKAHAHATLIHGLDYSGDQVFSAYTHSCATKTVVAASAQTCSSPAQSTHHGDQWFLVSGHYLDYRNDGTKNEKCDGCLDHKFIVP